MTDQDLYNSDSALDSLDLGACCACGKTGADVRNLISLPRWAPVPGTGWGCVVCGLTADGAMAVICDSCLDMKAAIRFVVSGYLAGKERLPFDQLGGEIFGHNTRGHALFDARERYEYSYPDIEEFNVAAEEPEMDVPITWYTDSPDTGAPACICSWGDCKLPIPEGEVPIRIFHKENGRVIREARFHHDCFNAAVLSGKLRRE